MSDNPLSHRPFALFFGARVASIIASQMTGVSIGWHLYALTGNALDLGLVGLAQFLPMLALTIPAGHFADRHDRRTIVALCQAVQVVAAALLGLGALGGWLGRDAILALVALLGSARAFEAPTMAALLPGLVARDVLPRATAWSVSANQTAQIVGPALGGLLYAASPLAAFGGSALLLSLAAVFISSIRYTPAARSREPVTLASLLSGFTFIRGNRVLLGILSLDLFVVLLGGATALLPVFARDILETGPWGLGLLRAAPAMGALGMSLWLARHPLESRVGAKLFLAVTVFGLATIVFGMSRSLLLSLAALAVLGAADVISVVIRLSLVQLSTPDEMRGRVSAVNSMFIGTSNQLGEFESGALAWALGAVASVVIGGIGSVVVAALWMWLFPELARVRTLRD